MSDNLLQRSVTTSVARNLANTTKTPPQMMSITLRWLLSLIPWVHVDGGTYRVNRTKVELKKAERVELNFKDGNAYFNPQALRSVPLFSRFQDEIINRMAYRFKTEEVTLGNKLVVEGVDKNKFFIIAQGQVEVLSKGVHGSDLRIALLTEGEYFGEIVSNLQGVIVLTVTSDGISETNSISPKYSPSVKRAILRSLP
jgi:hypothetical protein